MGVRERSPGRHTVSRYDRTLGRKVHVGTFRTRDEALHVEALAISGAYVPPIRARDLSVVHGRVVYFIAAPSLRLVKIGHTASLAQRYYEISRGSPVAVELVGFARGGPDLEARVHAQFAPLRRRGEWFVHDDALTAFIAAHDARRALAAIAANSTGGEPR